MASLAVSRGWWSYRSSLSRKSKASGLTRNCWFSLWTKRSHQTSGNVCRAKRENEKWTQGREAQHFSPTFSLVASIPANHRDQNSRANWRDWKWQCCRKGKSGSRQSYETDIIQVTEGWAGWPLPAPTHIPGISTARPPKAFVTESLPLPIKW